jgi:hypothetical protein
MNRTLVKVFTVILGAAACLTLMATSVFADPPFSPPGNPTVTIAPIDSKPLGKSYSEWAAEWQKWANSIPLNDPKATVSPYNPLFGGPCDIGQSGNVWFLAGVAGGTTGTVYRNCTVPKGTSLFFPIVNYGYAAFLNDMPLETRTLAFVRQYATCSGPATSITAKIDGVAVKNPGNYYEQSVFFELQLPLDNILGLQGTDPSAPGYAYGLYLSPGADSGYYLFLNQLKPGTHTIAWNATWPCGTQDIKYDITVTP